MSRVFIRSVGGLLTSEFLDELAGPAPKESPFAPASFGYKTEDAFLAEVARAFDALRARYREVRAGLKSGTLENGELRRRWLLPFFRELGFDPQYQKAHLRLGDQTFAISHLGGPEPGAPPLHLVAGPLDQKPGSRGAKSPHALLQAYLNHPESPNWGLVTNGRVLRLLSQNFHPRPAYVEVDLEGLFDAGRELALAEFRVVYRLIHRSRFYKALDAYQKRAREVGTRDAEALRAGARRAVEILGNAFLTEDLRRRLAGDREELHRYYQELLDLLYRLVFLLYAESRGLIPDERAPFAEVYRRELSLLALRELAEDEAAREDREADLFERLLLVFDLVREGDPRLGVPALGGELFAADRLGLLTGGLRDPASRAREWDRLPHPKNAELLEALRHLTHADRMRINYRDLGVEELGHIYEGLLGLVPDLAEDGTFRLKDDPTGRKASGSYYTPRELVGAVIEESLKPLIEERLKGKTTPEEKEAALLAIRVVDPAMGSGAFLIGALDALADRLAEIWVEAGRYPGFTEALPEARHRVAERSLYGVDLNPMAVELAKLSIWIAASARGRPLSFLDHHLKVGNALLGAPPDFYRLGIPKDAYTKRKFKDPEAGFKERPAVPKEDLENLQLLAGKSLEKWRGGHAGGGPLFDFAAQLPELPKAQKTAADVEAAHRAYARWRESDAVRKWRLIADYWTAAWFAEPAPGVRLPDHRGLDWLVSQAPRANVAQLENSEYLGPQTRAQIEVLARRHRFFHWWLEFPEVFLDASGRLKEDAGFDAVLGNPPWERVKLEDKQFFAGQDPEVAGASNKAEREKKIAALKDKNSALYQAYRRALADAAATSNFLHTSGRYPLTGRGDVNTYAVFAEHARHVLGPGRSGILLPGGIATDDTNKVFFQDLFKKGELFKIVLFTNKIYFKDVGLNQKLFALLALSKPGDPDRQPTFFAYVDRIADTKDTRRKFKLSFSEIALLNPNTRTLPLFRTGTDAELTKAIYHRVPVLIREEPEQNPWGVRFLAMFHMSNDSHLFKTRAELEARGFSLRGNRFEKAGEVYLPLYEAKMIWHYNHRYGTLENETKRPGNTEWPSPTPEQLKDPAYQPIPWYWIKQSDASSRFEKRDKAGRVLWRWERSWLLGFRNVTNSTNERTMAAMVIPAVGVGHSMPLMFPLEASAVQTAALLGNLSALPFDYIPRQKVGGTNLTYHYVKQFPILRPSDYTPEDLRFLVPRVLELVYTAWDLAPFARDVWEELSDPNAVPPELTEGIRKEIARRFAEHHGLGPEEARNDPRFAPPGWFQGEYPFPPFGWDEDRRALVRAELDAYYARLYGLNRKQLRYILDPKDLTEREIETLTEDDWEEVKDPFDPAAYEARTKSSTFPSETFSALKRKELRAFGEYRTRRLVLEAWERLFGR